jgi:HmuY protein
MRLAFGSLTTLLVALSGCSTAAKTSPANAETKARADAGTRDAMTEHADAGPLRDVACVEQSIAQLGLFDTPSSAEIREEAKEGDAFHTFIDASGGGLSPTTSFVYGRFGQQGLERVEISDEDAFDSLDWDIAVRRYVIRLNSGVSGPGMITGARTQPKTDFLTLNAVPDGLEYRTEQYFTDSCEFVSDGSGIGAPGSALASFWSYQSCVAMTGNVFVLALRDAHHVKLEVLDYYAPANQKICNDTGKVPTPSEAGNVRMRWAFLD